MTDHTWPNEYCMVGFLQKGGGMKASELKRGDIFMRKNKEGKKVGFELLANTIGTAFVYTVYADDRSLEGPPVRLDCDVELVKQ